MSLKSVLLFAGAALGHSLLGRAEGGRDFGCATPEPTEEDLAIAAQFAIEEAAALESGFTAQAAIAVDVWLHAVAATSGGLTTAATLQRQFDVLRDDFAPYGVNLRYAGSTSTVNSQWARDGNEMAMKQSLRRGTYSTLNIYILDSVGGNLGYCYFPTSASPGSSAYIRDGCSILKDSLPGGSAVGFNLGKTATHETGHWFGLYHTFQGGCSGSGDGVSDTPAQASPSSGCPIGRDSCPAAGLDPIHNYMDYSDDACYEEFTPGQVARLNSYWTTYRA